MKLFANFSLIILILGQKGRSVGGGATRTTSVLRSKPRNKSGGRNKNVEKSRIESSPPVLSQTSTVAPQLEEEPITLLDEESTGRSGIIGRNNRKPSIRTRPGGEVLIEGSLIHLDEPTSVSATTSTATRTERIKAPRLRQQQSEIKGVGSVVSSFPLMHSQVAVSSRVDVRIGGKEDSSSGVKNAGRMPVGQSLISKTVGTRIQDGVTTVHETSVIATTIDGQYAHFVSSTSRVFQDSPVSSIMPGIPGSVEVVTDLPSVTNILAGSSQKKTGGTTTPTTTAAPVEESSSVFDDSLPSLESLFKSVNEEELPEPEQQVSKKRAPVIETSDEETQAVVLKPSFRLNPSATSSPTTSNNKNQVNGNLERRAGLAPTSRFGNNNASPQRARTEEQRWRYSPSAKPKVAIQRTSGGSGSRFRDRVTTSAPPAPKDESQQDQEEDAPPITSHSNSEPDIEPTEVITLRVQTVTPEGYSNLYYEVATIKSPYIMRLGAIRNTRYVTLTKSFTRLFTTTPAPVVVATSTASSAELYDELPEPDPEISLDSSQPLPDPENILATTTPYENILKDSSDTATLPAIIVAATESEAFSLETVTETFSTTELAMKTSVLPYLKGGTTSLMTLTQSYFITRVVVAVKTVPPQDLYQFIPSKTLTDISTNLQEAGSEHINDRLLPGELEFSENDEFADDEEEEHRHEKRVPAPVDFHQPSDLSSIGQDFDLSQMDQPHQVELEPSLVDTASEFTQTRQQHTPPLPNAFQLESSINGNPSQQQQNPFQQQQETPVLTPEQLQQLALFRYMNPYAAAGLPFGYPGLQGFGGPGNAGGQVIQTSRPVVKTTDIIKTETVSIWDGVRTIYSTLLRTKGTTVITETEYGTTTLPAQVNPFQQQFTVMSSPVVTEVTTTSTELRIYRIIFRAQTTYTTVTSTTVFPTLVTTYVSTTIPIQPTAFPQGLFPGSYGFPNFG
nr:EOG090X017N [Eurycercus lamellatus]